MNPFFTYFDLLTNTFGVNTLGTKILSKYYEAYIESYFNALALANNQKQKGESKNLFMSGFLLPSEEVYEEWLKNGDTKLSDLLKSKEFSSLLSEYVKLHLELHRMLKAQGYPIQYFEDMYEYIKNNWN